MDPTIFLSGVRPKVCQYTHIFTGNMKHYGYTNMIFSYRKNKQNESDYSKNCKKKKKYICFIFLYIKILQ